MLTKTYKTINEHKDFCDSVREQDWKKEGFEALFAAENAHFWFITRKEFIFQNIQKFVPKSAKMLEVGAGTGNVSRHLSQHGYTDIAVGEMHLCALDYAASYGVKERYCFDLLNAPFLSEFDCVCAFDVLEHIEEDALALQNIAKMLRSDSAQNGGGGGKLSTRRLIA